MTSTGTNPNDQPLKGEAHMRPATLTAEQRELLDRLVARRIPAAPSGRIGRHGGDRAAMPLSPAQQRIWFFSRLEPEAVFYNVAGAARLRGRLDTALLHRCLGEIVERHEVLRTTYRQLDGAPVQTVRPFTGLDLPLTDLTDLPAGEREAAAQRLCKDEINRPFDLEQDLMLRPALLRLADDEHLLLICQHHIATDGWAMNVLIRELGERYSARVRGQEPALPELSVQYGDFAAWQSERMNDAAVEKQLDYWRERLADTRLVDIATGLPRSAELTWRGGTVPYRMTPETVARLTGLAETERATPFMALLAAQSVVLSRWSGQDDIVIGSAVAGRRRAELEHLAGCFVNELALRMDTTGSQTYRDLLRQAREVCLGAYEHQDVPFERIVEVITPERDNRARVPLVRHQMGFDNSQRWSVELPELTFSIEPLSTDTARFDLEVDLEPDDDGGIRGTVYFSTDVFTEAVVRRMMDSLDTLVDGVCRNPDVPVRELPVVAASRAQSPDAEPSAPVVKAPGPAVTVASLLEERARLSPDAVALRHGDTAVTFRELDEAANRLSWELRELGVLKGSPVAVCVPASAHGVTALLGVVKAGGVAVPLDPRHPVGHLNDVLLDCSTDLVLVLGDGPEGLDPLVRPFDVGTALGHRPADRPAATPEAGHDAFADYPPPSDAPPRGVLTTHAGAAHRLGRAAAVHLEGLEPRAREGGVLTVPPNGGACPWELLWPAAAGARLVLPAGGSAADLARTVLSEGVAVLACPASTLDAVLDAAPDLPSLRRAVCTDERPWPALADRLAARAPGSGLHAQAGPAHAALDLVFRPVPGTGGDGCAEGTRLTGAPEGGLRLRVLDTAGLLVPGAVPGELCVGGLPSPGGVLGRPHESGRLLADDPLRPGEHLVRTGLRARRLSDGTLELLGEGVRVRTHPVERTDVEAALQSAPDVDRALVAPYEGEGPEPELVAHVRLLDRGPGGDGEARAVFEETYAKRAAEDDPALNVTGWNSPHTGEYLTAAEMREWADTTFRRILALRPADVLEIGCRTGALLFRLAPRSDRYTGTDLSAHALHHIRDHQDWLANKVDDVTLLERAADDFDGFADDSFDTVVLNSVVQYFPNRAYLERVLAGALRVLRPGGHVYLGAVRSLPLLGAMHLPGQLELLEPEAPASQLWNSVGARSGQEEELLLDPRYFASLAERLPGLSEAYVLPRLGRHRNELGVYRYDVVLRAGDPVGPAAADTVLDWAADGLTADAVTRYLSDRAPGRLLLRSVPDARVHGRLRALSALADGGLSTVADANAALAPRPATAGGPVDPGALVAAAGQAGWTALVQYGPDGGGSLDVLLTPAERETESAGPPPEGFGLRATAPDAGSPAGVPDDGALVNDPLAVTRVRGAVARLRRRLQERLPAHAVPAHILVVPEFPLDRAGSADRAALPGPDLAAAAAEAHREPSTATEATLAGIWSEALGVDRVSVHDDFFALGGHSLLGSEVMDRVRQEYAVDVPLGLLFESPTIAAVAAHVDERLAAPRGSAAPIQRIDRSAQRRRRSAVPAGTAPSKENS
ncbi:condensation domain-containing protein [Streptomyces fructofermentans]|uniref:condensation domain-containing protein n=1 Tax=Streptomyces fructofermentans TaxID=152141 RepID=UPI00379D8930